MATLEYNPTLASVCCVAFGVNVCCLICVLVFKSKQKVKGALVNFQIASLFTHSIFNSYFCENFQSYRDLILETIVKSEYCLEFSFPLQDSPSKKEKNSFAFLMTFLLMSIWIELIYSIESVQLLKNPNSTFSLRGKISIVVGIALFIIHLISNMIISPNISPVNTPSIPKSMSVTKTFSVLSMVLSAFYLFYSIYAVFIINQTNQSKSNLARGIVRIAFGFLLVIISSSVFYISLIISSLVYIIDENTNALLSEFILYSLQGITTSVIRIVFMIKGSMKMSNEGNDGYVIQINEDSILSNQAQKGSVKLLAQQMDKKEGELPSLQNLIQSNYLCECFYYMLKVILHISSTVNDKKNVVKSIFSKEYSKRINHEIILGENTVSQIITSEEEVPTFLMTIMDKLALFSKKIRITEYSPNVFHNIMLLDKLKFEVIEKSFNIESNIENLCNYSGSEGKSGSIFFMTHDNKFLLKTIPEREFNSLYNGFLEKYYNLITESNLTTLMRIYGTFQLNIGFNQMYFILMENIAPFPSSSFLYKFDLKGSTKGRQTKEMFKKNKALKDLDYLALYDMDKNARIYLDPFKIDLLKSIMENDIKILYLSNLMDYSLFIGVVKNEGIVTQNAKTFYSRDKKYVYCMGIIDFLTEYKNLKSLEHTFLSIFNKKDTISAIHPLQYSLRFTKFVFTNVLTKDF